MSADRDADRIVRSWLEEGVTTLPDRVLDAVLDQVPATPQRRFTWWPARRLHHMNSIVKFGVGRRRRGRGRRPRLQLPRLSERRGPAHRRSVANAVATPAALPAEGIVPAGTYVVTPFTGEGRGICVGRPAASKTRR